MTKRLDPSELLQFRWTREMDTILRNLAVGKKTAQEIASIFNKMGYQNITRYSILGRSHRMGLRLDKFFWTAEMDAFLRKVVEDGKSAAEALVLFYEKGHSSLSRNALVGRSHRLGLRFHKAKERNVPIKRAAKLAIAVDEVSFDGGVDFASLPDKACRFPVSPFHAKEHKFCGAPSDGKSRYCADHAAIARRN